MAMAASGMLPVREEYSRAASEKNSRCHDRSVLRSGCRMPCIEYLSPERPFLKSGRRCRFGRDSNVVKHLRRVTRHGGLKHVPYEHVLLTRMRLWKPPHIAFNSANLAVCRP